MLFIRYLIIIYLYLIGLYFRFLSDQKHYSLLKKMWSHYKAFRGSINFLSKLEVVWMLFYKWIVVIIY